MAHYDWYAPTEQFLKERKIKTIMELGVGAGTNRLLDLADRVISLEIITKEMDNWLDKVEIEHRRRWKSELFYSSKRTELTPEVMKYLNDKIEEYNPDIVFVDCALNCRGAIVNYLFGKVDIISAHDTSTGDDSYKWSSIVVPEEYKVEEVKKGQGTTFWYR